MDGMLVHQHNSVLRNVCERIMLAILNIDADEQD
jgi:hypothetical protein